VPRYVRKPERRTALRFGFGLPAILSALAPLEPAHAEAGDTLRLVRARGTLRCGVSEGIVGCSTRDASGTWSGIDADFCHAVATMIGDSSNVVASGICGRAGERITFVRFLSISLAQLVVASVYGWRWGAFCNSSQ
jgi:ABC-type amino acid transport substrate-binding protein